MAADFGGGREPRGTGTAVAQHWADDGGLLDLPTSGSGGARGDAPIPLSAPLSPLYWWAAATQWVSWLLPAWVRSKMAFSGATEAVGTVAELAARRRKQRLRTMLGVGGLVLTLVGVAFAWRAVQRQRRRRAEALADRPGLFEGTAAARHRRAKKNWSAALAGAQALSHLRSLGLRRGAFIALSKGKTHYILDGPEDGPLVVLFHGFGVFTFVWEGVIDAMVARGYRVMAFDFFGFGFSDAPDCTFTADLFIQQARELVKRLKLPRRFTLLGHSMGGLLATEFTLRHPTLVERLVLVCPAGTPVTKHNSIYVRTIQLAAGIATAPLIGHQVVKLAMNLVRLQTETTLGLQQKRNLSYGALERSMGKLSRVSSTDELRQAGGRFVNMLDMTTKGMSFQAEHNPNFAKTVSQVLGNLDLFGDWCEHFAEVGRRREEDEAPTLIMWGDGDEFIPFENLERYVRPAMPAADVVVFEDTDHFLFLNRFDDFCTELFAFLDANPVGSAAAGVGAAASASSGRVPRARGHSRSGSGSASAGRPPLTGVKTPPSPMMYPHGRDRRGSAHTAAAR